MSKDYEKIADYFEEGFTPVSDIQQEFIDRYKRIQHYPFEINDLRDMFYAGYRKGWDDSEEEE